MFLMSLIPTSF